MVKLNKLAMAIVKRVKEFDDDSNPKARLARETIDGFYEDIEAFNQNVFDNSFLREIAKKFDLTLPDLIGLPVRGKPSIRETFRENALNPFLVFVLSRFTEYYTEPDERVLYIEHSVESMAYAWEPLAPAIESYKGVVEDALERLIAKRILKKRESEHGTVWYSVDHAGDTAALEKTS